MAYRFIVRVGKGCVYLCALVLISNNAFALDRRMSSSLSHYIMGGIYGGYGEIEQSIQEYKKALSIDYKNAVIHLNLALTYLKKNDITSAISELNLAIKFEPQSVEPHAILALLYFSQDKNELATSEYEIALRNASKLEPKNIEIYKSLGAVYLRQNKLKEAENTFKFILDLSPQDSESHFYLANIYDELKNRQAAIGELNKTLELNYDYPEALNYLGYIYVEENINLDKAEEMITKAVQMDSENGAYVDSLGWLYFKQGKYEEALKELKRAAFLLEDAVIFDHLGDVYYRMKDFGNAQLNWQKALSLEPNRKEIKLKLEKLGKEFKPGTQTQKVKEVKSEKTEGKKP